MSKNKKIILLGIICLLILLVLAGTVFLILSGKTENPGKKTEGQTQQGTETEQTGTPDEETDQTPDNEDSQKPDDSQQEQGKTEDSSKPQTDSEKNPDEDKEDDNEDNKEDGKEEVVPPTENKPPMVEIPVEDEATGLEFPCEVPDHDLRIEKLAPYTGLFVEDGTNRQATDVAMLLVYNHGDSPVEYAEIVVEYEEKTLSFRITALPAGERMVVQESSAQTIPEGTPQSARALVVHRANMGMAEGISVTDNGDNSLTVKNLTEETIPSVRVFYKYFMAEENLFVGGIAFTINITRLSAGGSVVVFPSHYVSQTSRVVMAQTYE